MSTVALYVEAFKRCYPQKTIELKPKKVQGEYRWQVIINSEKGELLLTDEDLQSATRLFNRGRMQ